MATPLTQLFPSPLPVQFDHVASPSVEVDTPFHVAAHR
jgi:hypothetical protein